MNKFSRTPKITPITEDYEISNTVLGLGINGKVSNVYVNIIFGSV